MGCGSSSRVPTNELSREEKIILEHEKELLIHNKSIVEYVSKIPKSDSSLDELKKAFALLGLSTKGLDDPRSPAYAVLSAIKHDFQYNLKKLLLLGVLLCNSDESQKADVFFSIYKKEHLNPDDVEDAFNELSTVAIKLVHIATGDPNLKKEDLENYVERLVQAQRHFCQDLTKQVLGTLKEINKAAFIQGLTATPTRKWVLWSYGLRLLLDRKFKQDHATGLSAGPVKKEEPKHDQHKEHHHEEHHHEEHHHEEPKHEEHHHEEPKHEEHHHEEVPVPQVPVNNGSSSEDEQEEPHCDNGHKLHFYEDALEYYKEKFGEGITITCDLCKFNPGESSWQCRECRYDLCLDCGHFFDKCKKNKKRLVMCTRRHRLRKTAIGEFYSSRYGTAPCFACNYCQDTKEGESWHCRRCVFDLCKPCTKLLVKGIEKSKHFKLENGLTLKFDPTTPIKNGNGSFTCEKCSRNFTNVGSFRNEELNYDICFECMVDEE